MIARQTQSTLSLSRALLLVMGILLLYLMVSFGRQVAISYQRRQELAQLQAKQTAAVAEHEQLTSYRDYATSDAAAEEWARAQGWAKPGEVPVIVVAPGSDAPAAPGDTAPPSSPSSNRDSWWRLFFGSR